MLIKRLMHRWVLMEGESGDAPAGGAPAAAPTATPVAPAATPAPSATPAASPAPSATPAASSLEAPPSMVGEATETPAEGAKPPEGDKPADAPADKPADAPVEYADFTLPEGATVDAETMTAFKEAAAGAKLSQEQAQAFVDMHQQAIDKASKAPYELWRDTQKKWQDEIKADPEFGGAKLEKETIPSIARAIKAFSPSAEAEKALRQAFHFTGAGNHPEIIRMMARVGKSLAEGSHVAGTPTSGDGGKSAAQKLYPTQSGGNTGQS